MIIVLYFFVFVCLLYSYRNNRGTVAFLLLSFYAASAFLSVLELYVVKDHYPVSTVAILYFTCCILVSLWPFLILGKYDSRHFAIPDKFVQYLSVFLIFWGLIELYYSLIDLYEYRQILLTDMSEIRSMYYQGERISSSKGNIIKVLAGWAHYIQYFSPFCCVYFYQRGSKKMALLLFWASLSLPVQKMTMGEREATLVFISNYLFCYTFFRNSMTKLDRARLIKKSLLLFSPFVLFFVLMTFFRFSMRTGGVESSLFEYGGNQPFLFSYFFSDLNVEKQMLGGRYCFGYLFPEKERLTDHLNEYIFSHESLNRFAGMPGSFLLDFGYYAFFVVLFFAIIYLFFIKSTKRRGGQFSFVTFFFLYFSYQILFMNIFYYDFSTYYGVIMNILLFVGIYCYTEMNKKKVKGNLLSMG